MTSRTRMRLLAAATALVLLGSLAAVLIYVTPFPGAWRQWLERAGVPHLEPVRTIAVDNYVAAIQAAPITVSRAIVAAISTVRPRRTPALARAAMKRAK